MKKTFLAKTAMILALAMLLGVLAACGQSENGNGSSDNGEFIDSIPADVKFEGEKFTVLARAEMLNSHLEHEITADENETETVNQAVFNRNSKIENRFGCKIEPYFIPGNWIEKDNFINTFKNSIMANSQAFDLIMSQAAYMAELGLNEYYNNFYDPDLKYINLSADYYLADIIKELTVNDRLYYLVGDYNLTYLENFFVLFFNKSLAADIGIKDLYGTVKEGKWTIDKMIEYARMAYNDSDGDGYKSSEDTFGLVTDYGNTAEALISQFDVQLTSKNEKGLPEFTIDQSKVVSILTKMIDFYDEDCVFTYSANSSEEGSTLPTNIIFTEGRGLFYPVTLDCAQLFRNMDTDFGIVPYPKWDEAQAGYYTQAQDGYSVAVIPKDVPNKEFTGAMIEALNAESSNEGGVTSAYYDIALKDKYSRDDESGEMIDLARDGAKVNFGYFHLVSLGSAAQFFRILMPKKMNTFVSYWAENINGYNRSLSKILKTYGVEQ